ncbi:MAG: serine hydrolase domain-containing protein [Anaerolineae bacterium]
MPANANVESTGLSSTRLETALDLLERATRQGSYQSGRIGGAAVAIYRHGLPVRTAAYGLRCPEMAGPEDQADTVQTDKVQADTPFLIASLTKPVVCAAAMLLVQEGALALDQRVAAFVPEFAAHGKAAVRVRHLFSHTSGLPDQLASSPELRGQQAPQEDFVQAVCACEPLFPAGARVSYQSMGILMLAEIVERVTGERLRDWMRARLFQPLGMGDSALGLPSVDGMARVALSLPPVFPPGSPDVGNDWNTLYWRDFGSPWGGLHSTVADLSRFLAHMLGCQPGPLSPATRRAMLRNQVEGLPGPQEENSYAPRWGLGWMLGSRFFGDLVSPDTFGHLGATGTLYWADPQSGISCVLLTNQPRLLSARGAFGDHLFARFSNAVAASVLG